MNFKIKVIIGLLFILGITVILGEIFGPKYFKDYLAVPQVKASPACTVNDTVTITGKLDLDTGPCTVHLGNNLTCEDMCETNLGCPDGSYPMYCGIQRLDGMAENDDFDTINCWHTNSRTCRCQVDHGGVGSGAYRHINLCCF